MGGGGFLFWCMAYSRMMVWSLVGRSVNFGKEVRTGVAAEVDIVVSCVAGAEVYWCVDAREGEVKTKSVRR